MSRPVFGNWLGMAIIGVFFAGAVILSTSMATRSLERVKFRDQTLRVKGTAERQITADLATWPGSIQARAATLTDAYKSLERSRAKLIAFLKEKGFEENRLWLGPVSIEKEHERDKEGRKTNRIESYIVDQSFSLSGSEVEKIATLARDASGLIAQEVELDARQPVYLCTQLPSLRMELLAEASANAYERATRLAEPSKAKLGPMRSASQGVFQVTPVHSNDVSDYGENDTTSKVKVMRAVVTMEYGLN